MTIFTLGAAVFVKTPGYSPLKTRLAAEVGREVAEEFHRRAVACVVEVVSAARDQLADRGIGFRPYWAVAEAEAVGDPLWRGLSRVEQGEGGLGERLNRVYARLSGEFSGVLLLGADQPQMRPEAIVAAACDLEEFHETGACGFHVGRVEDGGFSLFGGTGALPAEVWILVTYSAATTAEELIGKLRAFGDVRETKLGRDVDTVTDLKLLGGELDRDDMLPSQRALAEWLRRTIRT